MNHQLRMLYDRSGFTPDTLPPGCRPSDPYITAEDPHAVKIAHDLDHVTQNFHEREWSERQAPTTEQWSSFARRLAKLETTALLASEITSILAESARAEECNREAATAFPTLNGHRRWALESGLELLVSGMVDGFDDLRESVGRGDRA